jgi:hypothetical protein
MKLVTTLIVVILSMIFFSSCVDTEESIVINADNSGDYTLTIDMSKFADMMKNFKNTGNNADSNTKSQFTDSTIFFKDLIAQAEGLSITEKDLYQNGSFRMKVDEENGEMKFIASCPFKNLDQLNEIKKNLFKTIEKIQPEEKIAENKKEGLGQLVNSFSDQYQFTATSKNIANAVVNINDFKNKIAQDSTVESMQQMQVAFGEPKYKTTIALPKSIKKYNGPNPVLSKDKKSISFIHSQKEMVDNPAATAYSIEY